MNKKTTRAIVISLFCLLVLCTTSCGKTDGAKKEAKDNTETMQENEKMDVEMIYRRSLGNYLKEQLDLKEFDNRVAGLGCVPVDPEYRSEYQNKGDMGLTYIYLRNELHLERLSTEDMQLLEESIESTAEEAEDLVTEMVVRTFENCLSPFEIATEEDKKVQTMYDEYLSEQDNPRLVDMNSVVLQIATQAEYDDQDNIVDEDREEDKEKALIELAGQMENELDGLLGEIPIRVFVDPVQ